MNYFLIITNRWDYEIDVQNEFNCAGFPDRQRQSVNKMEKGDKIIYYVSGVKKFCAAVEIIGKPYYSKEQIWKDFYEVYPCRVPTKPIVYSRAEISETGKRCSVDGVYIKNIWNNLSFIKNKKKWGSQVMGSFRKITENDYNVITNALKEFNK